MKTKIRSLLVGVFSFFICSALIPYRVTPLLHPFPSTSPLPLHPLPNSVTFSLHAYPVSFQVNKDETCFICLAFVLIISLFAFFPEYAGHCPVAVSAEAHVSGSSEEKMTLSSFWVRVFFLVYFFCFCVNC